MQHQKYNSYSVILEMQNVQLEQHLQGTSGSQNIVIDWGDTTTSAVTVTTQTLTNKTYTPGSGTA